MTIPATSIMVAPGSGQGAQAIANQLTKTVKQIVASSTGWNPNEWEKLPRWEDALDAAVQGVTGLKDFIEENYDEEPPAPLDNWRLVTASPFKHFYRADEEGLAELRAAAKEYRDYNAVLCARGASARRLER